MPNPALFRASVTLDVLRTRHPAVACDADLQEGFVVQLAVDREHEDIVDWRHGLEVPGSADGGHAGNPLTRYLPEEQPSLGGRVQRQ